ncbi:MAG: acyltransferase [Dokdonella sp.]
MPRRLSAEHVAALDGLRGVAILLVLLHGFNLIQAEDGVAHVADLLLDLGWIGVQLFFVLSGFLISGILLDTRASPTYYSSFFTRRALRILPLYYGVLLVAFVILPLIVAMPPGHGQHQLWLWIYLANFAAPLGSGEPAFTHFWSLCVEEQFYLIWPFLIRRAGQRGIAVISALLVFVAIASRLYLRQRFGEPIGHEVVYDFTPCRMDALAIGALAAVLVRSDRGAHWIARIGGAGLAASGLALLLAALVAGHLNRIGSGMQTFGYSVIALGFAAILLGALAREGVPARGLSWTPLRRCGLYSYGMYVFYAPLHLFVGLPLMARLGRAPTFIEAIAYEVVAIAVTFVIAAISYHVYELRFLALKARLAPMPAT